jgi:hypothetical protein
VAAVSIFGSLYAAAYSGDPDVDRAAIRGNAVAALLVVFGLRVSRAIAQAFVAGILANELASREGDERYPDGAFPRGRAGYYPIGDYALALGPSVGPGQVLSGLHLTKLGVADPMELAKVGNEFRALYYAARVFREAYDAAGGSVADAIRRYNGSGPRADAYAQRATTRIAELGAVA